MQPAIATGRGWRWVQYLMIEVEQAQIAPLGIWSSGATPIPNPARGSVLSTGTFLFPGFHPKEVADVIFVYDCFLHGVGRMGLSR